MINRRPDPLDEHARAPRTHRAFTGRPPFTAIPQRSDADREHNEFVDRLVARFATASQAMNRDRRARAQRNRHRRAAS